MRLCVLRLIQEAKHSALSSINSNPKKKTISVKKNATRRTLASTTHIALLFNNLKQIIIRLTVFIATKKEKKLPLDEKKVHQTLAGMIFCRNFALAIER